MAETPVFVKYRRHFRTQNKMLQRPLDLVKVGYLAYKSKSKIALAESVYPNEKYNLAMLKVLPKYEVVEISEVPGLDSSKIVEIEMIDAMFTERELTKKRILSLPFPKIKKVAIRVFDKPGYSVFAYSYAYKVGKYTDFFAVPKNNILSTRLVGKAGS